MRIVFILLLKKTFFHCNTIVLIVQLAPVKAVKSIFKEILKSCICESLLNNRSGKQTIGLTKPNAHWYTAVSRIAGSGEAENSYNNR